MARPTASSSRAASRPCKYECLTWSETKTLNRRGLTHSVIIRVATGSARRRSSAIVGRSKASSTLTKQSIHPSVSSMAAGAAAPQRLKTASVPGGRTRGRGGGRAKVLSKQKVNFTRDSLARQKVERPSPNSSQSLSLLHTSQHGGRTSAHTHTMTHTLHTIDWLGSRHEAHCHRL